VAPHLQELDRRNAALEQRLAHETRKNLDFAVERRLTQLGLPNYQEVDRDPRWIQWLAGTDELSGRSRQTLLNDAVANGDVGRIGSLFKGFNDSLREQGSGSRSSAPGRSRSAQGDKPVYTPQQIKQIYEMKRRGMWKGREDEFARLEQDIFRAQHERRILAPVYLTK
jgi:hypothetical protein